MPMASRRLFFSLFSSFKFSPSVRLERVKTGGRYYQVPQTIHRGFMDEQLCVPQSDLVAYMALSDV